MTGSRAWSLVFTDCDAGAKASPLRELVLSNSRGSPLGGHPKPATTGERQPCDALERCYSPVRRRMLRNETLSRVREFAFVSLDSDYLPSAAT